MSGKAVAENKLTSSGPLSNFDSMKQADKQGLLLVLTLIGVSERISLFE